MTWRVAHGCTPRAGAATLAFLVVLSITGCTVYQPVTRSAAPAETLRHVVRNGDTVGELAKRYDVSIGAIAAANGLRNANRIYVGQVLTIPSAAAPGTAYASATRERSAVRVAAASSRTVRDVIPAAASSRPPSAVPIESPPARVETAALETRPAAESAREAPAPKASGRSTAAVQPAAPAALPAPERRAVQQAAKSEPPPLSGDGFLWPVRGELVDDFGVKPNGQRNDGINIAAPRGTPVRAAENGVVVYAGNGIEGFGNMVLLKHQDGFTTAYAHADELDVAVGDIVRRGQTLARVGATGGVADPQLHFELRSGRSPLDPSKHLVGKPSLLAGASARSS